MKATRILSFLALVAALTASAVAPLKAKKAASKPIHRIAAEAPAAVTAPAVNSPLLNMTLATERNNSVLGLYSLHQADGARFTPPARVLGDGTTIYGGLIYSTTWTSGADYGLYTFPASIYQSPKKVATTYEANGGGCYGNGKYYFNNYVYTDEMGYTFTTFCTLDLQSGETTRTIHSFLEDGFDQSLITNGMAYDPTTDKMYALSYIAVELVEGMLQKYYPAISEIDTYNGFTTPIARIPEMAAIAINRSGELFGISMGADAQLYRINKTTGDCTLVGSTGKSARFIQSATFDPVTGKLYWAAVHTNGATALYEVNTSTGAADQICSFVNHEEYGAIFIPDPVINDKAPATVSDLKAEFDGPALTGKITFTAPTLAADGTRLSGDLSVQLSVDGKEVMNKDAQPGEKIVYDLTLEEGVHGFVASAINDYGNSATIGASTYVGIDAPAAVGNLTAKADTDHNAIISWTAPTKGRNDGYIDPSLITYTIKRLPDETVVATGIKTTEFTDRNIGASGNYSYEVTPWLDGREGIAAYTDEALFGSGTALPCRFSFDTDDDYKLFTVIDANNDWEAQYHWGGWMYSPDFSYADSESPCAVYGFSPEGPADDWLIAPPFMAESGKKYRVTFNLKISSSAETLTVTAGTDNTAAAQNIVVVPQAKYTNKEFATYSGEFTATRDGNCFIGFHVTSDKKAGYLYIDDICIDEVPEDNSPQAVADLTATAGPKGALEATLSFTAPTKCVSGETLTSISRIDFFRGNSNDAIHSIKAPAPGSSLSWTDYAAQAGWNEYRIVAYNAEEVPGEAARTTVYVGEDLPLAPVDFFLTEENHHPVLRWKAPTEGLNGGYVDTDNLTYFIYRNDGTIATRAAKGTEFVDTAIDGTAKQYFLMYQIFAQSTAGFGDYAISNALVVGDPYKGRFFESFADQYTQNDPWTLRIVKGRQQLWGLASQGVSPACPAVDGDDGVATFSSTSGSIGDDCRLISPKLDIASMSNPVLSFYFYHNVSYDTMYGEEPFLDRLVLEALLPDGEFVQIADPIFVDDPTVASGWYEYTLPLSSLSDNEWIQLSFRGISDVEQDINIDCVQVSDIKSYDLSVYTFSGPSRVKANTTASYSMSVYNPGYYDASGYSLVLKRDGQEVSRITPDLAIASERYANFSFDVPTTLADEGKVYNFNAEIVWDADQVAANNKSEIVATAVTAPSYPEVYKLNATVEGTNVHLNWDEANALHVNDDFEDYPAFSNSNIGDFALYDGDGGYTYGFSDIYFEHTGEPGSYLVFNPDMLMMSMIDDWKAHSGSQCLAAFGAWDPATNSAIANDDWLISPEVFGGQVVTFWVKTANYEFGDETFRIYYSSKSQNPGDMVSKWEETVAPNKWTKVTVTLPDDAKYFAIVCTSLDKFVFYVDDISYVAKADAAQFGGTTGYRIYRDGQAIADLAADARSYVDTGIKSGEHSYTVRALYGNRESLDSDVANVKLTSGIDHIEANSVTVKGGKNVITISGADGLQVKVANAAGAIIHSSIGATEIPVNAGVYVVTVNNRAYKVIVK